MWRRVKFRVSVPRVHSLITTSRSISVKSHLVTSVIKEQIGIITLCDPSRLNVLTEEMGEQFVENVNLMKQV
jgi:enoyl-CoA hydratase/carnithine racemase